LTKVAVAVEGWNTEAAVGFALTARKFASSVLLTSSRETVDGKDEIEVMTLGPERGEEVLMAVDGIDEKEAFDTLLVRLLGAIESPRNRLAAVLETGPLDQEKPPRPPGRRITELPALGSKVVVPKSPRHSRQESPCSGVSLAFGESTAVPPARKKRTHCKMEPNTGRKHVTTRRRPRKRKK